MTTETPVRLLTAEEFWELPEPEHGGKMELLSGRVVTHMPVGRAHSRIAIRIGGLLDAFASAHDLGEVGGEGGFIFGRTPDVVRAPDVHFIRASRLKGLADRGFIDLSPDLAVEVLSPDDRQSEMNVKVAQYRLAGTPRVWVVDPETKTVMVYRPDGPSLLEIDDTLTSDDAGFEVAGFELPLREIFR